MTTLINIKNLGKADWQHLGSREVSILFATLVVESYKTTFPKVGLIGIEKALGDGVINYGQGLFFKAYRSSEQLQNSTRYFTEIFNRHPDKIRKLYQSVLNEIKFVSKKIELLDKRSNKRS